ncbi:LON peptidase substrate-binding domain-containing protein [Truepera radiovictrix]|uniref:LON peptidase substrate-binding domain-containing protein n=1 Tax=Truepera radiovictrix TaxID=332249 RepID=UPI0002FED329|nr:LON peptidase substrate-binding domain-containing protein [Truepera radiovictrix]WMT58665.1 LON peptidase substrate-binding domain-containing protein [Truepera radiovictrix]
MTELPLFPLPNIVVFPGMTLPLFIFEERYKRMVRLCVEQNQRRLVIVLAKQGASVSDSGVHEICYDVGSYADILSVAENPDGTFHILTHGQERCRVAVSRSESVGAGHAPLHFTRNLPYPLARDDPNLERLAAWDALEVFRSYSEVFFPTEVLEQIESALPDDLLFQASFICANLRAPAEARQRMLEAPSLIARFGAAQETMQALLKAHRRDAQDAGGALDEEGAEPSSGSGGTPQA